MLVDLDHAAIVALDPDLIEAEAVGVGAPADRDQDHVGLDLLDIAAFDRLDAERHAAAAGLSAGHFGTEPELEPLAPEDALGLFADLVVHTRQDAV